MNIEAVAKRARVSTATVSRALNGSDKVREKTAARVLRAVDELGYIPNLHARSLSSGRSGLYGLVLSDLTNPFFPDLISTFERLAGEHDIEIIIANTNYDTQRMKNYIFRFLARKVDGLAIMTSELHPELIEELDRCKVPLVFLNQENLGKRLINIRVDYTSAFEQAVDHLVDLGHKDLAFISGPQHLSSARRRRDAVLDVMQRRELKLIEPWLLSGDHRIEGGYLAMQKILQQKRQPTAVLASNDLTAIGAIGALQQAGLRVPRDMSVVGFDDIALSGMLHPPLTTLRLSREEIATRAFHALYKAAHHEPSPPESSPIAPQLVIRRTTAAPAKRSAPAKKRTPASSK